LARVARGDDVDAAASITRRYELVQSADDAVCGHMLEVYNTRFGQPWDVTAEFEARLESLKSSYFGNTSGLTAEQQREILWTMRFDLVPTSAEFEAVHWRAARFADAASKVTPHEGRIAVADMNNDGQPDLVTQRNFLGTWDEPYDKPSEVTEIFSSLAIFNSRRSLITYQEMSQWGRIGVFSGNIVRPFLLNGTTYFSRYQRAYNDSDGPPFLYHPESMFVERFRGGPDGRKLDDIEVVCEFRMVAPPG